MNYDNIVKIGTALKWRGVFDITKKYYQENIVSSYGCVFRCRSLHSQGITPLIVDEETGHLVYVNQDVWDVVVDMADYYNQAVDSWGRVKMIFDHVEKLDQIVRSHEERLNESDQTFLDVYAKIGIEHNTNDRQDQLIADLRLEHDAFKVSMSDHEDRITALESAVSGLAAALEEQRTINIKQQEQIDSLLSQFTVIGTGVWLNDYFWDNSDLWQNEPKSGGEVSTTIIESYDPDTFTIYFGPEVTAGYDEETQTVTYNTGLRVSDYDEVTQTLTLNTDVKLSVYDEPTQTLTWNNGNEESSYDAAAQTLTWISGIQESVYDEATQTLIVKGNIF